MIDTNDDELNALRMKRIRQLVGEDSITEEESDYPDKPIIVSDGTIQEFIKNYPLVVVDCWAPWCGPCRSLAPIFEALAKSYHGKIVFGKLNVDENQRTAQTYQTMSIPTMLIFKEGKLIDRIVGALPKPVLEQKIGVHIDQG